MSWFSRGKSNADGDHAQAITDPSQRPNDLALAAWFQLDHQDCDARWVRVEALIDEGDAGVIEEAYESFEKAMLRHLAWEEQVLFPEFEAATGMTQGPTQIMRMEHEQMRGMLRMMNDAVQDEDFDALAEHGDTLLMLIQQHNQKEEGMLYPMAERALGDRWSSVREVCQKLGG